ncbi:hypothetical protein B484DRAFT_483398, partial [Ochromonadaceae sp. CCMP2298]
MSALRGRVQELTLAVGALSNSSRMGTGSGSSGGKLLLPVLPEKLVGGLHSALYAQYEVELARQPSPPDRDSKDTNEKPQNMQEGAPQPPPPRSYSADSSVCFLVRTGRAQDPQYVHKPPMQKYLHMGLDVLVQFRPPPVPHPAPPRSLAQQDYLLRHDLDSDRRCLGIEAVLALSGLAYTASPVPKTVDMAAIFLRRDKLLTENVWFGNFSDAKRFHCLGCNGGYFTQYLVRNRGWTYTRLPIDGLRSAVFHGPSPTHCIAAGNVWFDHPREIRVGCLGHDAVQRMLRRDLGRQYGKPPLEPYFDWDHYNTSDRVCLRLSRYGAKSD